MTLTFPEFWRRWPDLPGDGRALAFDSLSERERRECWADLAEHCRHRIDGELLYERRLREAWPPPKRSKPHHGTATSTSTAAGRVELSDNDPLKAMPAAVYLPALAGVEVSSTGRCRCPMPDHEDVHPSAMAYGTRWTCFSCGAGGSIIDLASALSGIAATGSDYWRVRDWILHHLVWAPLPSQRRTSDG